MYVTHGKVRAILGKFPLCSGDPGKGCLFMVGQNAFLGPRTAAVVPELRRGEAQGTASGAFWAAAM